MKVVIEKSGKIESIVNNLPSNVWYGRILDIGSRDSRLERVLGNPLGYYSLDIDSKHDPNFTANIEDWDGFDGQGFATVAALDVLEHTDDICKAFKNVCRLSRNYVVISLPNCYYYKQRLRFLVGKTISGKYGLPIINGCKADRHKWLFTMSNAMDFVEVYARACKFEIVERFYLAGRRYRYLRLLPMLWPRLFARTYVVLLQRTGI